MAKKGRESSAKVISLVLAIAFGVVAIILTVAAFSSGSFELRSKAVQEEIVLKQWQFENNNAEGWVAVDFLSSKAINGYFEAVTQGRSQVPIKKEECKGQGDKKKCKIVTVMRNLLPTVQHQAVNTDLPFGIKKLKFQIAVLLSQSGIVWAQQQLKPSPPPITPAPYQFPLEIRYRLKGKKQFEKPISVTATADDKFHEYEVTFPDSLRTLNLVELRFEFSGLRERFYTTMRLDNIRLVNMKVVRPSPRPTVLDETTEVTKEGKIIRSNLEGAMGYILMVSEDEQYGLLPLKEMESRRQGFLGGRPREIDFREYVGCQVRVSGRLVAASLAESKNKNYIGIPQSPRPKQNILVRSITKIGECTPTSPSGEFQPTPQA